MKMRWANAPAALSGGMAGRSANTDVQTKIAGLAELKRGLEQLTDAEFQRVVWASLGAGGRIVKNAAVQKVPVLAQATKTRKPGTVRDAIRVSRSKFFKGSNGFFQTIVRVKPLKKRQIQKFKAAQREAGLRQNSRDNPNDPYYWWFVEFGTSKMAARPFLRPAFEETRELQLAAIRRRVQTFLAARARKIAQELKNAA